MNTTKGRTALLVILMAIAIVACGQRSSIAPGHSVSLRCNSAGQVVISATQYGSGAYSLNGAPAVPFTGGFNLVLSGTSAQHIVVTADDWPTFDQTLGPCEQPTTSTIPRTTAEQTTTTEDKCPNDDCIPNTVAATTTTVAPTTSATVATTTTVASSTSTSTTTPPSTSPATSTSSSVSPTTAPSSSSTTTPGVPTTLPSTFSFGAATTVCIREVPTIRITFQSPGFPSLAGRSGTLTMTSVATGQVISTQPLVYQPGATVDLLYPGTRVNADGTIADVPGWNLNAAGFWVRDPSDEFLRDGIALTYTVNPTATATVTYPPESANCANPDGPFPPSATTVPAPPPGGIPITK